MPSSARLVRGTVPLLLVACLAACGDDGPSGPGVGPDLPVLAAVIRPESARIAEAAAGVQVTSDGTVYLKLPDRIARLDASGNVVREITVIEGDPSFVTPFLWDFAATSDRIVVLLNVERRIQVLDPAGTLLRDFGFEAAADDGHRFRFPFRIAATDAGDIYLSDMLLRRIQRFDENGVRLGMFGSRGTAPDQFETAEAIAIGPGGTVHVLDVDLWRIVRYSRGGIHETTWDLARSVQFGAFLDGYLAVLPDGRPVVVDITFEPGRTTILGENGAAGDDWLLPPFGDSPLWPGGVAATPEGDLLFSLKYDPGLVRHSAAGEYLGSIGVPGQDSSDFVRIDGVACGPSGRVTLFDGYLGRMLHHDLEGRWTGTAPLPPHVDVRRVRADGEGGLWFLRWRFLPGPPSPPSGLIRVGPDGAVLSTIDLDAGEPLDFEIDDRGRLLLLTSATEGYSLVIRTGSGATAGVRHVPRTRFGVAPDLSLDSFGRAWILDGPDRLIRLDPETGALETAAWPPPSADGVEAVGIFHDDRGFLHVVDRLGRRILVYDRYLNRLGAYGAEAFAVEAGDGELFGRSFSRSADGTLAVQLSGTAAAVFRP